MTHPDSTTDLLEKLRRLEETIASLKEELRRQKQENAYLQYETERSNVKIDAMTANIRWRKELYDDLVGDNEKMTKKNEDLERLVGSLKSELARQKAENERITAELEESESKLEGYIDHQIASQERMSNRAFEEKTALLEEIKQLKQKLADIQH